MCVKMKVILNEIVPNFIQIYSKMFWQIYVSNIKYNKEREKKWNTTQKTAKYKKKQFAKK